jgi:Tol biopolymer transport system component
MSLPAGTRLGSYEIVAPLGSGGMGEVFRARDTKLDRDVAIKILPDAFASDTDRVARFTREAQVLAALNHPHIAQIHGFEDAGEVRALVMELVEGEDLSQQIARAPLPLDEALAIAKQIAEALEAAHEKGIIHRDLKPANIKLTPDGTVKVLDFGLAKAFETTSRDAPSSVSMSPTFTATQVGVILGTAAYMAPEQARGKAVDKRADIWAFGCVVYEMVTGRPAFPGDTVTDIIASVVKNDPDWTALPPSTPPHVRQLLRRCLQKDSKQRLRDIGDARVELEQPASRDEAAAATATPARAPQRSLARRALPWIAGAAVGSALTALITWAIDRPAPAALRPAQRLPIAMPATLRHAAEFGGQLAISPDATRLVFPALEGNERHLYLRHLDRLEAQPIPGTDSAGNPFFSPDGEWIAFFTPPGPAGKLKKVAVQGGPPVTISDANVAITGAWSDDGMIIFTRSEGVIWSLYRVPSAGGTATKLTTPVPQQEFKHAFPDVLPGGRNVLFSVSTSRNAFDRSHIALLSLETGRYRTVIEQGYNARYIPSGHIVYALGGNLMAVPFDLDRLETTGPAVPVIEGIRTSAGEIAFAVASTGIGVYAPATSGRPAPRTLVWVDRSGKEQAVPVPPREYTYARLSPDGRRIALDIRDQDGDIWIWNFERRNLMRLTFDPGPDTTPVWTSDGKRIIFARGGTLYRQEADGTGQPERLFESAVAEAATPIPEAVTPDGMRLLFRQPDPKTAIDLHILSLAGDRRVAPLFPTPSPTIAERNAEVSPDGRWVAYQSNESGRYEIYVRPFPNVDSGLWQVSSGGGTRPVWSRDGRELFYATGRLESTRLMVSAIAPGGAFSAAAPRLLFEGPYVGGAGVPARTYDVSPDGQRFLMMKDLAAESTASIHAPFVMVLNFFDELKRLAPPKR